jgi:hypothetical protein
VALRPLPDSSRLCTNATDIRRDGGHELRHVGSMDDAPTDDALFLDMIETIAVAVLETIGDDPEARFAFFKRFTALAQETVREAEAAQQADRR